MNHVPKKVRDQLVESLADQDYASYGQIATVDQDLRPEVRTVHFRWVEELATIGFSTCTESPKWRQLAMRPAISGCYFDTKRQIQFRWRGRAILCDGDKNDRHKPILDRLWSQSREEVRQAYWETLGGEYKLKTRCPIYGAVFVEPEVWDVFFVVEKAYRQGKRFIYNLAGTDTWSERRVSLIDSHAVDALPSE